jgi:hypothetical protein
MAAGVGVGIELLHDTFPAMLWSTTLDVLARLWSEFRRCTPFFPLDPDSRAPGVSDNDLCTSPPA